MDLMNVILSRDNLNCAYKKVKSNKGASGVDTICGRTGYLLEKEWRSSYP